MAESYPLTNTSAKTAGDRKPLDIAVVGTGIAGLSAAWLLQA